MNEIYQQPYIAGAYVKEGVQSEDEWRLLYPSAEISDLFTENDKVIIPLKYWLNSAKALRKDKDRLGLLLTVNDDLSELEPFLSDIPVVAIWFDEFSDGRGFSLASTLRERFHYQGELRAVGYYLLDQLYYFKRCGFNSFNLRHEQNVESAINAWSDFTEIFDLP